MRKICTIFIGLILVLGSVSAGNADVLFHDSFNDGDFAGWSQIQNFYGTDTLWPWSVEWSPTFALNARLQCTNTLVPTVILLDSPPLPRDFVLELNTRTLVDGGGASLIAFYIHWFDWNNWIGIGYRPGRFYIEQWVDGIKRERFLEDEFAAAADPYAWHHLKLIKDKTFCRLYFDGALIISHDLPVVISGGHLALAGAPGTHQFDNVVISPIIGLKKGKGPKP